MTRVVILVNTGTPDDPGVRPVRKYLSEFLNDPFVIDIPWALRKILVNLIIVPFRARHSASLYSRLWTKEGSPLRVNMEKLAEKLQKEAGDEYRVIGAMRYGNPSLEKILTEIKKNSPEKITIFPLFPQYASSTTGSIADLVERSTGKKGKIHQVDIIDQYHSHPAFIKAYATIIREYDTDKYDHIVFSYHGLPLRHLRKIHREQEPESCRCDTSVPEYGRYCYKAACYETSRLLAHELGLNPNEFSTTFQSRLSKNWISPFTDETLLNLASVGKKRVLVAAPSFTADCLETLIEINEDYRNIFLNNGGEEFEMVESLNYRDVWIKAIMEIVSES